jgi:NADH kinase
VRQTSQHPSCAAGHTVVESLLSQPPELQDHDLLGLNWPQPPRNILLTKKDYSPNATQSLIEYAKHIHSSYTSISIILEPHTAEEVHGNLPFPVFTHEVHQSPEVFHEKVDLISTLGGDGTILRASSLFASSLTVPPMLSFSMGTLGFLGEWKFKEHKRAFRETYMSGAQGSHGSTLAPHAHNDNTPPPKSMQDNMQPPRSVTASSSTKVLKSPPVGWSSIRGKFMGEGRTARVLVRNRLKVGIYTRVSSFIPDPEHDAQESKSDQSPVSHDHHDTDIFAMNEVIIHRGRDPHLAIVEVFVGGRFLTEAVADGMIISTPTGSTAYSLSSGGSIVHPLVSSLLLTPICPRSLSFRPLVLPANTPITLRLSEKNRGREVEVSVDGIRRKRGLQVGMELRVEGEEVRDAAGNWKGGVPSIVRGTSGGDGEKDGQGEDSWVGGLNSLLKFNYPFGEEA